MGPTGACTYAAWVPDGKYLYLSVPAEMACLAHGRTYVLPVGPKSPPSLGIQVIKYGDVAPAPLPSVYSFSHESVAVTD